MIDIEVAEELLRDLHPQKNLRIRLEVDTDRPGGFETETQYILQPIPFPVRVYALPDLFAGKLHAILCRKWKRRVKGRDWYDLAWYVGHYPEMRISHLESRMRQSGDDTDDEALTPERLQVFLTRRGTTWMEQARREEAPFIRDIVGCRVWSDDASTGYNTCLNDLKERHRGLGRRPGARR